MDELRWILLVVGALIIGAIYYFGESSKRDAAARKERDGEPLDPELADELERLGEVIQDRDQPTAEPEEPRGPPPARIEREPERVVALYLEPRGRERIAGQRIFDAADTVGMTFGEMNIFHRFLESDSERSAIYSLANMTKPGDFDPAAIEHLECRGLCLFLTLPNPLDALDAWDAMLATGQRLADLLDADLQDESHSSLSRQRIAHIREQMREFDRKTQLPRSR